MSRPQFAYKKRRERPERQRFFKELGHQRYAPTFGQASDIRRLTPEEFEQRKRELEERDGIEPKMIQPRRFI